MAKKQSPKFISPDIAAREAEASKTARLRGLRLAKEAEEARTAEEAASRVVAAKLRKPSPRRRAAVEDPAIVTSGST